MGGSGLRLSRRFESQPLVDLANMLLPMLGRGDISVVTTSRVSPVVSLTGRWCGHAALHPMYDYLNSSIKSGRVCIRRDLIALTTHRCASSVLASFGSSHMTCKTLEADAVRRQILK